DSVLILLPTSSNRLVSTWQGPGIVTSKISENSYRINIDGGSKTVHANRLRLYKCQIATVGVIFDEEEQFGEIEYYPELEKDRDNEKRIKELDLSHLGVNKADQLRKVLLKHTKLMRWVLFLSRYDITIIHLAGTLNFTADCLSRCL